MQVRNKVLCVVTALAAMIFALALGPAPAGAAVGDVTVFTAGYTGGTYFGGITTGPDGNLWFTKQTGPAPQNQIGRMTPTGSYTFFGNAMTIQPGANIEDITTGSDGNLWFTELDTGDVGRITPTGTITEFLLTDSSTSMTGITSGPDGNLWIAENFRGAIGTLPTTGSPLLEFSTGITAGRPQNIATGPDGNLWFNEFDGPKIGKITTGGTITEYSSGTRIARDVAAGPDGNVWFTEYSNSPMDSGRIGRIGTDGSGLTEFNSGLSANPGLGGITLGADGNLWFTEQNVNKIGRITPTGTITEYPGPQSPTAITDGPDGNIWFMTSTGVGRIITGVSPPGNPKLTVTRSGNGSGKVTGNGISCPSTCSASYPSGTQVSLTATPDAGSSFTGWSGGDCDGTGTCEVTVLGAANITAEFTADPPPPAGKPKLANLKIKPKSKKIKRGKKATFKVVIKNIGGTTAKNLKLCAKGPKKLVKLGKCKKPGNLAPGKLKTVKFKVKVKKGARKGKAKVTFTAIAKGTSKKSGKVKVKVR